MFCNECGTIIIGGICATCNPNTYTEASKPKKKIRRSSSRREEGLYKISKTGGLSIGVANTEDGPFQIGDHVVVAKTGNGSFEIQPGKNSSWNRVESKLLNVPKRGKPSFMVNVPYPEFFSKRVSISIGRDMISCEVIE